MTLLGQTEALTAAERALLERSLAALEADADRAAEVFYARLFDCAPELRALFPAEMADQGRKFMATLATMVRSLGDSARLLPQLRSLAARHDAHGVKPEHFRPMGEALIATLREVLGEALPPGAADLWHRVYDRLAGEMIALGAGG